MNIDRLIHEKKNFAELDDKDVETFLRERKFNSEHLGIEFKSIFPPKGENKYKHDEVCAYIIGFLNSEGGLLIYGVENTVNDKGVKFPEYICGLAKHPSIEDMSEWAKGCIDPQPPISIRFFTVAGKEIAVIKIPEGVNKPYCFSDPNNEGVFWISVKTSGGVARKLTPSQIWEFHRSEIILQSERIVASQKINQQKITEVKNKEPNKQADRISSHQEATKTKLEDIENYGYIAVYCYPDEPFNISLDAIKQFVDKGRFSFSESMRYAQGLEYIQNGVSLGYYPKTIKDDIKSTARTTVYTDGFIALDTQANDLMDGKGTIMATWLTYEIQRHLQLAKAILEKQKIKEMNVYVDFQHVDDYSMTFTDRFLRERIGSKYQGHKQILRKVSLDKINSYDGKERNIVFKAVISIMDEVSNIFGLSKTPEICWDEKGYLYYVKGLESQR
jgi:hypothetical protein